MISSSEHSRFEYHNTNYKHKPAPATGEFYVSAGSSFILRIPALIQLTNTALLYSVFLNYTYFSNVS